MKKALIIEDDPVTALYLEKILLSLGVRSKMKRSIEQALDSLRASSPDVIFLDLTFTNPEQMTYEDFLKERLKLPFLRQIPVLIATGTADLETIKYCRSLGAHGYLIKPFMKPLVYDALKDLGVL